MSELNIESAANFFEVVDREFGDIAKEREALWKCTSMLSFPCTPWTPAEPSAVCFVHDLSSIHMMEQLLDLSLLKVEERSSVLLGRCRSLLERRRTGLGLLAGWSLFMQARAAVRKTLWMLFSDVKAEHSR